MASPYEALAREAYDALNRRDLEGWANAFHSDVEATSLIMEADGVEYRGREGMRKLAEDMITVFGDYRVELKELHDVAEDTVVARVHVSGTGDESGIPIEVDFWGAGWVRDGLFWKGHFYRTEAEALAAIRAESG